MKDVMRVIGKILLSVVLIVVLAALLLVLFNRVCYMRARGEHKKAGYYNAVKIGGGRKMNVAELGAENGTHTIVGIAGQWVSDYSIYMNRVNKEIGEENTLVYIDRAGNGFSADTLKKQTIEQVVSDYRAALQAAGYEAPYVLMPFSLGGMYATYWENQYPDEIEGVIYIDCCSFTGWDLEERGAYSSYTIDQYTKGELFLSVTRGMLGLQRFDRDDSIPPGMVALSDEERRLIAMADKRGTTFAVVSEVKCEYDSIHTFRDTCKANDIPKMFIGVALTDAEDLKEYYVFLNRETKLFGGAPDIDPETAYKDWEYVKEQYEEETNAYNLPFVEAVGNCEYVSIPGDHYIFLQKPKEVSKAILNYLKKLAGSPRGHFPSDGGSEAPQ